MSRHPDPCNCNQAREYERFLEIILDLNQARMVGEKIIPDELHNEIDGIIQAYHDALEDYRNEDSGPPDDYYTRGQERGEWQHEAEKARRLK